MRRSILSFLSASDSGGTGTVTITLFWVAAILGACTIVIVDGSDDPVDALCAVETIVIADGPIIGEGGTGKCCVPYSFLFIDPELLAAPTMIVCKEFVSGISGILSNAGA